MGPYALFSCPEKIRGLPPKTTEEIDFEKKIGKFFVFTLGDYIYHFEREYANAHFKTFQGPFECKIEV